MAIPVTSKLPLRRQLRSNLIVLFVLLAVVPVMLVGYFTIRQIRAQTTQQVMRQLESVSVLKQAQLESWLNSVELTVDGFLSHTATRNQIESFMVAPEQDERLMNVLLAEALRFEDNDRPP